MNMPGKHCLRFGYVHIVCLCIALFSLVSTDARSKRHSDDSTATYYRTSLEGTYTINVVKYRCPLKCTPETLASNFPGIYHGWNTDNPKSYTISPRCRPGPGGRTKPALRLEWSPPQHSGAALIRGFEVRLENTDDVRCAIVLLKENLTEATVGKTTFDVEFRNVQGEKYYSLVIQSLPKSDDTYIVTNRAKSLHCDANKAPSAAWKPSNLALVYHATTKELHISFDPPPEEYKFEAFDVTIVQADSPLSRREETMKKNVWTVRDLEPGVYDILVEPQNRDPYDGDRCVCKNTRDVCQDCIQSLTRFHAKDVPATTSSSVVTVRDMLQDDVDAKDAPATTSSSVVTVHDMWQGGDAKDVPATTSSSVVTIRDMLQDDDAEGPQSSKKESSTTVASTLHVVALTGGSVLLLVVVGGTIYTVVKRRARKKAEMAINQNNTTPDGTARSSNTDDGSEIKSGEESYRFASMEEAALEPPGPNFCQGAMPYATEQPREHKLWANLPQQDNYKNSSSKCSSKGSRPRVGRQPARNNIPMRDLNLHSYVRYSERYNDNPEHSMCGVGQTMDLETIESGTTDVFYSCRVPKPLPDHLRCPDDVSFIAPSEDNFDIADVATHRVMKASGGHTRGLPQTSLPQAKTGNNSSMTSIMDKMDAINWRYQSFVQESGNEGEVYSVGAANV